MEQALHSNGDYDYRQYDRVWQRVGPGLEPFPPGRGAPPMGGTDGGEPEMKLPGAQADPCCMGSAAAEMLEVLTGFIEEELADRRYYLALSRRAPAWARQKLLDIAAAELGHARRLMAIYYLITGECYRASLSCDRVYIGQWCAALRERYHAEACGGFNYIRAADGTTDPCLTKLLTQLSEEEYRHATEILTMLERSLAGLRG